MYPTKHWNRTVCSRFEIFSLSVTMASLLQLKFQITIQFSSNSTAGTIIFCTIAIAFR